MEQFIMPPVSLTMFEEAGFLDNDQLNDQE